MGSFLRNFILLKWYSFMFIVYVDNVRVHLLTIYAPVLFIAEDLQLQLMSSVHRLYRIVVIYMRSFQSRACL